MFELCSSISPNCNWVHKSISVENIEPKQPDPTPHLLAEYLEQFQLFDAKARPANTPHITTPQYCPWNILQAAWTIGPPLGWSSF